MTLRGISFAAGKPLRMSGLQLRYFAIIAYMAIALSGTFGQGSFCVMYIIIDTLRIHIYVCLL